MKTLYTKLLRYLYTLIYCAAVPLILVLGGNARRIRRWPERFGFIKKMPESSQSIWVHAVSMGETLAALPLIKALIKNYPNYHVIVTSGTASGSEQVLKHLKDTVLHTYVPLDIPSCVKRFLKRAQVKCCIILETELWPNLLLCTQRQDIPIILANARLSGRSAETYQRMSTLTRAMLDTYFKVIAQSELDGERLLKLGLDPSRLVIGGNIKFDMEMPDSLLAKGAELRKEWHTENRPTLIAASTHETEEEIVLEALKIMRQHIPNLLLVLVPRHPERFAKVKKLCETHGFQSVLRSQKQIPTEMTDIILGDTMGELRLLYATGDVAFVGGSLVPIGGHNLIEPAVVGLPVLTGPHLDNFIEIRNILIEAEVAEIIDDGDSLAGAAITLFLNPGLRQEIGERAQAVVAKNQGALQRHLEWIAKTLAPSSQPRGE